MIRFILPATTGTWNMPTTARPFRTSVSRRHRAARARSLARRRRVGLIDHFGAVVLFQPAPVKLQFGGECATIGRMANRFGTVRVGKIVSYSTWLKPPLSPCGNSRMSSEQGLDHFVRRYPRVLDARASHAHLGKNQSGVPEYVVNT